MVIRIFEIEEMKFKIEEMKFKIVIVRKMVIW